MACSAPAAGGRDPLSTDAQPSQLRELFLRYDKDDIARGELRSKIDSSILRSDRRTFQKAAAAPMSTSTPTPTLTRTRTSMSMFGCQLTVGNTN